MAVSQKNNVKNDVGLNQLHYRPISRRARKETKEVYFQEVHLILIFHCRVVQDYYCTSTWCSAVVFGSKITCIYICKFIQNCIWLLKESQDTIEQWFFIMPYLYVTCSGETGNKSQARSVWFYLPYLESIWPYTLCSQPDRR